MFLCFYIKEVITSPALGLLQRLPGEGWLLLEGARPAA